MDAVHRYRATTRSVHDGDSVTLDIDLGFNFWWKSHSCRLLGINAPELSTPEGKVARDQLRQWLPLDSDVYVVTQLDHFEKYGRILVTLFTDATFTEPSLNQRLIDGGFAVVYPPR